MKNINIIPPVKDVLVTQPFAKNFVDFYQKMGLDGHPGIDFRAKHGCDIFAAHDGEISWCGNGRDGGIGIEIWNKEYSYKTFYYHHDKNVAKIQKGIKVTQGEKIAEADNTGKYTTGSHEHFELYFVNNNGRTLNKDNGYKGSVDPAPYFKKNWDKDNAYHRYGKEQNWIADWQMRFKNVWLHKQLIARGRHPLSLTTSELNALVYGSWDFDIVMNGAMHELWGWSTKSEFKQGKVNFK